MLSDSGYTAFVTGGTGFVGSHLVELLLAEGFSEVRCLVRSELKFLDGLPITVVPGDMSDLDALSQGVRGVDYVFHVAALTRTMHWDEFKRANVDGTENLLRVVKETNREVRKVLLTSSLAAIGRCDRAIAVEKDPFRPISQYGRSKMLMEEVSTRYFESFPCVIVRPPAVYGPRESDIYTFFKSVNRGICPIVGSGKEEAISLVHVRDLVRGMLQAALADDTAGETYFLGSPGRYSWNEIRDASATALGRRVFTLPIPSFMVGTVGAVAEAIGRLTGSYPALNREKATEIKSACKMCDHSKAASEFGYAPSMELWSGVKETTDWYRKEGWL